MSLVKNKKVIGKMTLLPEGIKKLIELALKDDPTYCLHEIGIHACGTDMYIREVTVCIDGNEIILEVEEVNY